MIIPAHILDKFEEMFKADPELRKTCNPYELCLDVYKKVDDETIKELVKLLGNKIEEDKI